MQPSRGLLLVRPVDSAERFADSAIIIPADARERLTANQFEVVSVGAFAECDDEDCERSHETELCNECTTYPLGFGRVACCDAGVRVHPHPVRPGDWILVRPRSAVDGPDPEHPARFVHQDAVLGVFNAEQP